MFGEVENVEGDQYRLTVLVGYNFQEVVDYVSEQYG